MKQRKIIVRGEGIRSEATKLVRLIARKAVGAFHVELLANGNVDVYVSGPGFSVVDTEQRECPTCGREVK